MSSILGKIGGLLIKSPMKKLKKTLDIKSMVLGPMLGLKKAVFKGHGSSDEKLLLQELFPTTTMVDYIKKDIIIYLKEIKNDREEK